VDEDDRLCDLAFIFGKVIHGIIPFRAVAPEHAWRASNSTTDLPTSLSSKRWYAVVIPA
jgi:hypothetical protein